MRPRACEGAVGWPAVQAYTSTLPVDPLVVVLPEVVLPVVVLLVVLSVDVEESVDEA